MKITHVCSRNLEIFDSIVKGSGYYVSGMTEPEELKKAISSYNAGDVLGLIVHTGTLTKHHISLIKYFDDLFLYAPRPIILLCDNATTIAPKIASKLKSCSVHPRDTVEGTVSDADLDNAFTTLCCTTLPVYDLSVVEKPIHKENEKQEFSGSPLDLFEQAEKLFKEMEVG